MSVDTHFKGKNLTPYRTMRVDDFEILVAPDLSKIADKARLVVRQGVFGKKLVAEVFLRYPTC